MTNTLPKFNLTSTTLKTEDDLIELTSGKQSPFFKPGKHEVKITKSTYTGLASDADWGKYQVEMTGAGGQTIRETVLVPFKDIAKYRAKDGKNTNLPARKLTALLLALGETVSLATLDQVLPKLFAKDNLLVGMNLAIDCAFKGNHVKRQGDEVVIVSREGDRLVGTPAFQEYEEANKYAAQNKIDVKGFVDIVTFNKSSVANTKKTVDASW